MMHMSQIDGSLRPLTLAERLINLAADASDAGFTVAAEHLIHLADQVLNRPAELGF
jgi:predicted kinase